MCYSGIFCKEKLDANHLRFKGFINCQLNAIHDRLNEIFTVRTRRIEFQISVERITGATDFAERKACSL